MHPHLTALARYGFAAVPGLVFCAVLLVPELRHQHRHHPGNLQSPHLWFWVTLLFGLCFGLIPYVLLQMVPR